MDCTDIADRLAPFLDGELSPGETTLVGTHLDHCVPCQARCEAMAEQDFGGVVRIAGSEHPEFWARLDETVDHAWAQRERAPSPPPRTSLSRRRIEVRLTTLLLYAAGLALTLAWGAGQWVRADRAVADLVARDAQFARADRLAAEPPADWQIDQLALTNYTPHRGTF
jgi:anti-sigma factor RsiW